MAGTAQQPHQHVPAQQQRDGAPYVVRMDPERARELAAHGGTLLLLGVPPGTLVGIDQHVFTSGPKFQGVKMLPPGAHLVTTRVLALDTASPSRSPSVSPATGFFVHLEAQQQQQGQVVVRRWDAATETLLPLADEDEERRYALGVRRFDFDQGLAPYNLRAHAAWARVSGLVTAGLVTRLSPAAAGGNISIVAEGKDADVEVQPRTAAEARLVAQLRAGRQAAAAAAAETGAPAANGDGAAGTTMEVDDQQQPAAAAAQEAAPGELRCQGGRKCSVGPQALALSTQIVLPLACGRR